jgi:hypothetical protein
MKAVTIRVNDVEGVAGFVLPGDCVDVVLTRQQDKTVAAAWTGLCGGWGPAGTCSVKDAGPSQGLLPLRW